MTKVAVITPCFNAGGFIGECIASVEKSVTLGIIEVKHIIVDDGSTDGTREILQGMDRPQLKRIFLDNNYGPGYARNAGWQSAGADYIFFLDADDVLFANSLRYLVGMAEETGSPWVYGDFVRGDERGRYLVGEDYYGWQFKSAGAGLYSMYTGRHFFQQNSLYLKRILEEAGGFDSQLAMAEDFDLATRLLLAGHLPKHVRGPLYMHRYHTQNLSQEHLADPRHHWKDVANLYRKHCRAFKKVLSVKQTKEVERWAELGGLNL